MEIFWDNKNIGKNSKQYAKSNIHHSISNPPKPGTLTA